MASPMPDAPPVTIVTPRSMVISRPCDEYRSGAGRDQAGTDFGTAKVPPARDVMNVGPEKA
jgi:hypothetical protein